MQEKIIKAFLQYFWCSFMFTDSFSWILQTPISAKNSHSKKYSNLIAKTSQILPINSFVSVFV